MNSKKSPIIISVSISIFILLSLVCYYFYILNTQRKKLPSTKVSISLAGKYLEDQILPNGKFVYRVNMNPSIKVKKKYNILRHMGAVYALNMLEKFQKGSVDQTKIKKTLEYMIDLSFAPVEGHMLGVWSSEKISGQKYMKDQIKLGAVGLSLVAICQSYNIIKDRISISELEKLGDFILYMQKPSGGFYSKYLKDLGRDGSWTSLYYPGEAAFGLVELYKLTKKKKYLNSAIKVIHFLYNERKNQKMSKVPADHWALIASDMILRNAPSLSQESHTKILSHANKVVRKILSQRVISHRFESAIGGFTKDGRTTPTATRVEGLVAIYKHLKDPKIKKITHDAIVAAAIFLQKAQVLKGRFRGAIPRSIFKKSGKGKKVNSFNTRASEVRIDYVQHALSALIETSKMKTSP
jgi:hypothetical protein